jgi:diguanylate cyclase (GGDEF)-like protein
MAPDDMPSTQGEFSDLLTRLDSSARVLVERLLDEFYSLRAELSHSQSRLAELERLADTDPMLPLLNRRAFMRELHKTLGLKRRHKIPACLMYVDMDGLKALNDGYGHAAGDAALRHVADVMARAVRTTDAVGRLGGDEFGVLLLHTTMEGAVVKANDIVGRLKTTPLAWQDNLLTVSISWGMFEIPDDTTVEQVVAAADHEMYRSRSERRRARGG